MHSLQVDDGRKWNRQANVPDASSCVAGGRSKHHLIWRMSPHFVDGVRVAAHTLYQHNNNFLWSRAFKKAIWECVELWHFLFVHPNKNIEEVSNSKRAPSLALSFLSTKGFYSEIHFFADSIFSLSFINFVVKLINHHPADKKVKVGSKTLLHLSELNSPGGSDKTITKKKYLSWTWCKWSKLMWCSEK